MQRRATKRKQSAAKMGKDAKSGTKASEKTKTRNKNPKKQNPRNKKPKEQNPRNKEPKEQNQVNKTHHVEACKRFFDTDRLKKIFDEVKEIEKPKELIYGINEIGEVYDITGLSAIQVIAVLTAIINNSEKWPTVSGACKNVEKKTFYFLIKAENKEKDVNKIFSLQAKPTSNQPGNGTVSVLRLNSKGDKYNRTRPKRYKLLTEKLVEDKTEPKMFAQTIEKLFKNNSESTAQENATIAEVYFLLLLEIARRLSNNEGKTDDGKELDDLPVGSVIARKIKQLAENGDKTNFKTELESFFKCFMGRYSSRTKAINNILLAEINASRKMVTQSSCEGEIEEMFCGSSVKDSQLRRKLLDWSLMNYLFIETVLYCRRTFDTLKDEINELIKKNEEIEGKWSSVKGGGNIYRDKHNNEMIISCKYDKKERRWALMFAAGQRGNSIKQSLIKRNSALKDFAVETHLYWKGGHDNLQKFVKECMKVEGEWQEQKFKGHRITIDCKQNEDEREDGKEDDKQQLELIFQGANSTTMKEYLIELQQSRTLELELDEHSKKMHDVKRDGNCFFRAVSHQLYGTEDQHGQIRSDGIDYIKKFKNKFQEFLEEDIDAYIERMSKDSEWCDHIIMQAVASARNLAINVIQPKNKELVLKPQSPREISVGYINGNHYVSVIAR